MSLYRLAWPLVRRFDPETAHALALWALRRRLVPARRPRPDPVLRRHVLGLTFANPVGLAAGFDKDGTAVDALAGLGFGFVETGTVTPRPQAGNARPRLVRLEADGALINRMGFNNAGATALAARLARRRHRAVVGANIGKNRDSTDAAGDYGACARVLAPLVDYLVINVSSPNTPGLRALQDRAAVDAIAAATREGARATRGDGGPPVLLKVAPDLTADDRAAIAACAADGTVDGLIATNTTIQRPDTLRAPDRDAAGGLSGRPLAPLATRVLADLYRRTGGTVPLVAVGGIDGPDAAYARIRAGAGLVQLYTALIYAGPGLVREVVNGLADRLRADGFTRVADAVGVDAASHEAPA